MFKRSASIILVIVLLLTLGGCQKGKKFSSSDAMISEMCGTYAGVGDHANERVIISGESVIRYDLDKLFPDNVDSLFFEENFASQDWRNFTLDILLSKSYTGLKNEPTVTNLKNSTISDLWIDQNGILYSQAEIGYPYTKISSETSYHTEELETKFSEYVKYLRELEVSYIIKEANDDYQAKNAAWKDALSSAANYKAYTSQSSASAETIANAAFDVIKGYLKYPHSASLEKYSTAPQKDDYGRVATVIVCKSQNGFGNYITDEFWVVLQSCSNSGEYTYLSNLCYITGSSEYAISALFTLNSWDKDPSEDAEKEPLYDEGLRLAEKGSYEEAIQIFTRLGDYKRSKLVISACEDWLRSQEYKKCIDLFQNEDYKQASDALHSFVNSNGAWYLKSERTIYLCELLKYQSQNTPPATNSNGGDDNVQTPPTTTPSATTPSATTPTVTEPPASTPPATTPPEPTIPSATTPTVTEPPATTPPEPTTPSATTPTVTEPPATTPPASTTPNPCANGHTWIPANCLQPSRCSVCHMITGTAQGHLWYDIKETIEHPEVGHYETVQEAKSVQKYQCAVCYGKYASKEEYYAHFDEMHKPSYSGDPITMFRERFEIVSDWEYYDKQEWVVDQKAYIETIITGQKCSRCGQAK